MNVHLLQLRQELASAMEAAQHRDGVHVPAGKWTCAEILEHLFLTYKNTSRGLEKCLEKGIPLATSSTLKQRVATVAVVSFGYLPEGRKSPERAVPMGMSAEEVRATILTEIDRMESGFANCERRFGAKTKILDHPVLGPLNALQWSKFHLVHGRHHVRQMRERGRL